MRKIQVLVMLSSAAISACSRKASESPEAGSSTTTPVLAASASTTAANGSAPNASTTGAAATACPRTGLWALCSVEGRLAQAGFVVSHVAGQAPRRAGFSVVPAVYKLGRSRLEVFVYPTESALAADVAKLDTIAATPRGAPNPWPFYSPTFVRSGNLAAVFLTDNGTQAERLTNALAAGAPQP